MISEAPKANLNYSPSPLPPEGAQGGPGGARRSNELHAKKIAPKDAATTMINGRKCLVLSNVRTSSLLRFGGRSCRTLYPHLRHAVRKDDAAQQSVVGRPLVRSHSATRGRSSVIDEGTAAG
jgi:hypothetical protein